MNMRIRNTLLNTVIILAASLAANMSFAQIEGVWRGSLQAAPGTELLVEFTIASSGGGSYSVVLNTPESATIQDVAATDVSFSDDTLSLQVTELSGSFEGKLENGALSGSWSQLGESIPFELNPYVDPGMSAAQIASIEGKWQGTISRGETPIQAVVWRFEIDDSDELIGFMGPASRGAAFIPMQNISITDSGFSFNVNDAGGKYEGAISNGEVIGNWTQQGQEMTLNMIPREDVPVAEVLSFSAELLEKVLGDWSGTIVVDATQSQDIVWRFESAESGKVTGLMGPAARGVASIPMQNVVITETDITFDVMDAGGKFSGKISTDIIEGTWTQGQEMSMSMSRN